MKAYITFAFFLISFLYAYFGYPVLLAILSLFSQRKHESPDVPNHYPEVTLLIAAYNEEDVIEEKVKNSLALGYPQDKLHIVVVSDGSTDRTDEIVKKYEDRGVELFRTERLGKTVARNRAVENAKGELIVLTDANAFFRQDALKKLVKHFQDPGVGVVCGALVLKRADGSENLYWRYEKLIKRLENKFHSIIGANGSIYAMRRELYDPLPPEVDDDFVEPLIVYMKGKKAVYELSLIHI